jgi:hypothetical protein
MCLFVLQRLDNEWFNTIQSWEENGFFCRYLMYIYITNRYLYLDRIVVQPHCLNLFLIS